MTSQTDDGTARAIGECINGIYRFMQSVEFRSFNLEFTLWDVFMLMLLGGFLIWLWHEWTD